jgi:hypothetical protein
MAMNSEERATLLRALMAQKQKPPIDEETFFNDSSTGSRANYTGAPFEPNQTRSWKIGWLVADTRHDDIVPLLVALIHVSISHRPVTHR